MKSRKFIKIIFLNEPIPNVEYILYIQPSIKSLIEALPLNTTVSRTILFESEVVSSVVITSPVNYEKFKNSQLHFEWQEFGSQLENFFRIQIAQENIFANPIWNVTVDGKTNIDCAIPIEEGQYYVRVRAEKTNANSFSEYGRWSETVTFLSGNCKTTLSEDTSEVEDNADWTTTDDDIIIEDNLKDTLVTAEYEEFYEIMPESIKILFSEEINTDTAVINIFRRDV